MTTATRTRRAKTRKGPPARVNLAAKPARAKPPTEERGSSGTVSWGGVLSSLAADYAPAWQPPQRWKTIEKMRADPLVSAALTAVTAPILGAPLTVEPASDDPQDVLMAEFVEASLKNMTVDFLTHRQETLRSVGDGVAVFYPRYEKREDGLWWLRKLKFLPNKSITTWHVDPESGDPDGISQLLPSGRDERFKMDELLVFTHNRVGGSLLGEPLLRAMYPPFFILDKLRRVSAIAVERGASGTPWAKYVGGPSAEAEALDEALQGLHANERAFLRIDENVEDWGILGIEGAVIDAVPLMEFHRRDLLASALVQWVAQGMDGVGARAVSEDHSSIAFLATEFIKTTIEETYNKYLVPAMVGYNWTVDSERLPKVKIGELDTRNLEAWFGALGKAVEAGVELQRDEIDKVANELLGVTLRPKEEEPASGGAEEVEPTLLNGIQIQAALDIVGRFTRKELSYTQAETALMGFLAIKPQLIPRLLGQEAGDPVTGDGSTPQEPTTAAPGADVADVNDPNAPEATTDADAPSGGPTPLSTRRMVTFADGVLKSPIMLEALGVAVDFAGMESALDEAEARIIRDLAPLQEQQRRRLVNAAKDIVKKGDVEAVAGFNIQGDKEEAAILAALVALYEAGGKNALAELEQQGVKPSKVAAASKAAALVYLGGVAAEAARSLVDRLRTAWGAAVIGQIQTGWNADALLVDIAAPGERLLLDVARRGSSTALGMGRTDVSAANAAAVAYELWSAVMDKATCRGGEIWPSRPATCWELDGTEFAVGEGPPVWNPDCKGRWRCRCLRIAIAKKK